MTEYVWVERTGGGAIKGIYANKQPGYAEEQLPDDNPEVVAFRNPPPVPPLPDANARLDAGIAAALTEVIAARNAIHSIPHGGALPARFEILLTQLNVLTDAVVAMLQAQASPP
jgi:hypothetical protein